MQMDNTVHTVATVGPRGSRGTGGNSRRSGQRVPESPNKALVSDGQRDLYRRPRDAPSQSNCRNCCLPRAEPPLTSPATEPQTIPASRWVIGHPSPTGRAARGELLAGCGLDASVGWSGSDPDVQVASTVLKKS